jgi:hypothetical protein
MNYTIQELFLEAFGLKVSKSYNPETTTNNPNDPNGLYTGIEVIQDINQAKEISGFGTPIIFPIRFLAGEYQEYNLNGEIVKVKKEEFRIPITAIVDFKRDKYIETTKINGSYSSAKETIVFDDWQINIKGFFLEDKSQPQGFYTAIKQEKEMLSWEKLVCSIPVLSEIFLLRGIKRLVIKSFSTEQMRGKPHIRTFTITALSDNPIELNIQSRI